MFHKILLAVDGSEHSIRATKYSIALAKQFNSVIDAVYVVDESTAKKDGEDVPENNEIEKRTQDETEYIKELLEHSKVIYGTHVLYGDPGDRIIRFANDRECDCVVIGHRGLNQLKSLILGSVSNKVVRQAACPVLIVK